MDGACCLPAPPISCNSSKSLVASWHSKARSPSSSYDLLILDDIAYVTKDQAETSVLFELIAARYERRSMLITANQPFGEWGKIFPDQAMTLAAIDRLVHHATILEMNVEGLAAAITLDIHLQNRCVMDQAIDGGKRHSLVGKDLAPFAKWLIGRYQHGFPLVTCGDQLEQHAGYGLILGDVGDVVEDEQIVAVELGDRAVECELATSNLEPLHEIGSAGEHHAPSILDQGKPERCRQMALAAAG